MQISINSDPFFKLYKQRDIIYPNAISRHFSVDKKDALNICENMVKRGNVKRLYMVQCPVCARTLPTRYYSTLHIDVTNELGCDNCGLEFLPNTENIMEYFEKL